MCWQFKISVNHLSEPASIFSSPAWFRAGFLMVIFLFIKFPFIIELTAQTNGMKYRVSMVQSKLVFSNPPFKACHASTIVEAEKGKMLISCFGGSYEGASDVGIWLTSYDGKTWDKPAEIITSNWMHTQMPCWNPVLFKTDTGTIKLFYKQGKSPRNWWGMVTTSPNNGLTWSNPSKLPEGFLGPVKNKPVRLTDGNILCPSSTETVDDIWRVHLEIADPTFTRWEKAYPASAEGFGVIQPSILIHRDGKLQMLCRSRENKIVQSWSTDNGKHWSKLSSTLVPNPNSGIDAVTLSNGLHVLVYNPLNKGKEWFNGRNILKVAISEDGISWMDVYTLEDQEKGEFSYPAVIESSDSLIHITYTADRINIRHVILKLENNLNYTTQN